MAKEKQKNLDPKRIPALSTYCVGNIGYEMLYMSNDNYGNFFFTEIAALSPMLTGTIITIASALKAILSPISGMVIDAAPFKKFFKDKHTPWVLIMPVVLGALYILMTISGIQRWSAMIIGIIYTLFLVLAVFLQNGYRSAIASLSSAPGEAAFLASGVNISSNIGRTLTGALFPLVAVACSKTTDGKSIDSNGFLWATIAVSFVALAVYWISVIGIKKAIRPDRVNENPKDTNKEKKGGTGSLIKQVITNKNILVPFMIGLALFFRSFSTNPIAPYYFKYIAENEVLTAAYATATNFAGLIAVILAPFILALVFRNNIRLTMIVCLSLTAASHFAIAFFGQTPMVYICLMCSAQFFYEVICVLLFSAFVDACDVLELENRRNGNTDIASGTAMSLHFTAVMVAQVFAVFIRNFGLKLIGYTGADTVVTPAFQSGLLKLLGLMPGIIVSLGIIASIFYTITPEYMKNVRAELSELRAKQNAEEAK